MPPVPKAISAKPATQPGRFGNSQINALATGKRQYLITKAVPPKVRRAIELMVFDALSRPEAAIEAGITDNWLYQKLKNPEVMKYYRVQSEVLRCGQRHKNLHTAIKIRDTSASDKSKIDSMRFLEGDYSERDASIKVGVSVTVQPGYICDISQHSQKAKQILQLGGKLIEHEQ